MGVELYTHVKYSFLAYWLSPPNFYVGMMGTKFIISYNTSLIKI